MLSRHRRPAGQAGVSLVELLVGMVLTMVVGALALAFFVNFASATTRTTDQNLGTAGARNTIEGWVRLLTLADSPSSAGGGTGRFQQLTPTSAIFYANINRNRATTSGARTAPMKIFLSLEGGQLVERDYAPATLNPLTYSATPTTHYLVSHVTTTGWLFTPYVLASPPAVSEPDDCTNGAPGLCAGVPEADAILPTVIRVDIAFTVAPASGGSQSYAGSANITGGTT